MMKYNRFEDIPVWREGVELAADILVLTQDEEFKKQYEVGSKLRTAALAISSCVSRGFEGGSSEEMMLFLNKARQAAAVVCTLLYVLDRLDKFKHLNVQIFNLIPRTESIVRHLRLFTNGEQRTETEVSPPNLAEKTRRHIEQKMRTAEFIGKIKQLSVQQIKHNSGN